MVGSSLVAAPFSPEEVVREFSEAMRAYGGTEVRGDRYGASWVRERFEEEGIRYEHFVDPSGGSGDSARQERSPSAAPAGSEQPQGTAPRRSACLRSAAMTITVPRSPGASPAE